MMTKGLPTNYVPSYEMALSIQATPLTKFSSAHKEFNLQCNLQNSLQHSTQETGCSLSQCHPLYHQSPIYYPPLRPVCSRWLALTTY